jgi:hypothetical protein
MKIMDSDIISRHKKKYIHKVRILTTKIGWPDWFVFIKENWIIEFWMATPNWLATKMS